jgi:hypothetical protein
MRKIYSVACLLLIALMGTVSVYAQQEYWSSRSESSVVSTDKAVARQSFPREFKLFALNIEPLRRELFSIVGDQAAKNSTIITIPNANGQFEQFEVFEASNFEPALQAMFPEIRAYSGRGITDRAATLKLSISPQGIQTMVFRTEKQNEFIEAYSQDHTVYAVFNSSREKGKLPWTCTTEDQQINAGLNNLISNERLASNTGELKTIRLAQSCNGEYANWFGAFNSGQVAIVLAAYNGTLTRCNGCYEKDLALHLNLIPSTVNVIYYDPLTDPYTTMGNWNNQLQATLTANIGEANYDIGHMFGASGGGGNAGCIGCVCVDGQKGRGITSPADGIPMGDNFDIDYVAHEVGHQLGGNHTFSHGLEGTGQNKEVGAGITIMGYAGITPYDPAPHSIDIFHETSIQQIQVNLATKSCPITTNITATNATPVITPLTSYTIPMSTPFALTGNATDANPGDVLTYCFEQNDNSPVSGANSVASPTKVAGPNWLSFPPTTNPTRLMPRLSTILAGLNVTPTLGGDPICNVEALSSVDRTLNFRLTVRDNSPYVSTPPVKVGQTAFADMSITVTTTAGPFAVTSPNTAVTFAAGVPQTITWDVNGTNTGLINTANVKISLSTDGGITFPTVLAASTANDGSESVIMPCVTTTTARVKIEAIGNIYFDISNSNFNIQQGFSFTQPAAVTSACPVPSTMSVVLPTNTACGFSAPITMSASPFPVGTSVSFSPNPVTPGNSTTVTLNNTNTLAPGTYTVTVNGTAAGAPNQSVDLTFIIATGTPPTITTHPASQTICAGSNATFSVTATDAAGYQWQVNNGSGFTDIPGATTSSYTVTGATAGMNGYQYRVVVAATCTPSITSNAATLTVVSPAALTVQPTNKVLCSGSNTSFTATATGATVYQWQVNTGSGFVDVVNNTTYAGATTNTLSITGATAAMSTYQYRLQVRNATCISPVSSNAATLTVHALPVVSLTASDLSLVPGHLSTLTAVLQPTGTPPNSTAVTSWFLNNTPFVNAGNTFVANVEQTGTYAVQIIETWTDGSVCINRSPDVVVGAAETKKLYIFPSPNDGTFTVSYFNTGGASSNRTVTIYDSHGAKIHQEKFAITGPYTLLDIDIKPALTGIYYVVVSDASGKKLAEGKVLVH